MTTWPAVKELGLFPVWMALFPVVDDVIGRVLAYCPLCQNLVAIGPGVNDLGPISGFEGVFPAVDDVTTRPMTSLDAN